MISNDFGIFLKDFGISWKIILLLMSQVWNEFSNFKGNEK
jgi:hypothetical protein